MALTATDLTVVPATSPVIGEDDSTCVHDAAFIGVHMGNKGVRGLLEEANLP